MGVVGAAAAARSLPSAAYRPTEQDVAVLRRAQRSRSMSIKPPVRT